MSYSYSPQKRRPSGPPGSLGGGGGGPSSGGYRGRPPPQDYPPRDYGGRYRSPPRSSSSYRPTYSRQLTPPHSTRSLSPTPSLTGGANTPASVGGPGHTSGKPSYPRYRERDPIDPPPPSSYRRYERPRHPYPPPRPDYRPYDRHSLHSTSNALPPLPSSSRPHSSSASHSSRPSLPSTQSTGGLEYGDADDEVPSSSSKQSSQPRVKAEEPRPSSRTDVQRKQELSDSSNGITASSAASTSKPATVASAQAPVSTTMPEPPVKVKEEEEDIHNTQPPPAESLQSDRTISEANEPPSQLPPSTTQKPALQLSQISKSPSPPPSRPAQPLNDPESEVSPQAAQPTDAAQPSTSVPTVVETATVVPPSPKREAESEVSPQATQQTDAAEPPTSVPTDMEMASVVPPSPKQEEKEEPTQQEDKEEPTATQVQSGFEESVNRETPQIPSAEEAPTQSMPEDLEPASAVTATQETSEQPAVTNDVQPMDEQPLESDAVETSLQSPAKPEPAHVSPETHPMELEEAEPSPNPPVEEHTSNQEVEANASTITVETDVEMIADQDTAPNVQLDGPAAGEKEAIEALLDVPKREPSVPPKTFDELLHRSAHACVAREEAFIEAFMKAVPNLQQNQLDRPKLADLTNCSKPRVTTYHLPPVYQHNHEILRPLLEADFNKANRVRQAKIDALRERYWQLHQSWKLQCERREREKYQHDHRPLPAGCTYTLEQLGWAPSASTNSFQPNSAQLLGHNIPPSPGQAPHTPSAGAPNLLGGAPGGVRTSRRSGGGAAFGHPFGDAVRSEAEFYEILRTLEDVEFLDPKSRAAKSAAVVPDMLLFDDPKRAVAAFDDDNAKVEHPEAFYGIANSDVARCDPAATEWSDQEVQIFLRRFAQFPKQFGKIKLELPDKTVSQCVLFYYRSKRSIDFRSLVERKYAGGRKSKRSRLLETSSGSSSLFTEVQERSKAKGKKTAPHMLGADDLGLSPPGTPQTGPVNQPSTYFVGKMLHEPLHKTGLGAQVTHNILYGTSRRTEVEAQRAKRKAVAAESKAAATAGPPSESQLEAAEALASLFGGPADQSGEVDLPESATLKTSQQAPRTKRKLNPTSYWSAFEKAEFVKWLGVYGKDFPSIAQHIPNKSHTQCRNYWANHHTKLNLDAIAARATGIVPPMHEESPYDSNQAETPATQDSSNYQLDSAQEAQVEEPPTRPSLASQRKNTPMQLRDLLNATEDFTPDSTTNTPADWFGEGTTDAEEGQQPKARPRSDNGSDEEEDETPIESPATAGPTPSQVYYQSYGPRDSYFPQMPLPYNGRSFPPPQLQSPGMPWSSAAAADREPMGAPYYGRPPPYYSREPLPPMLESGYRGDFERRRSSVGGPSPGGSSVVEGYARRPSMPPYDYAGSYRYSPPPDHRRFERSL